MIRGALLVFLLSTFWVGCSNKPFEPVYVGTSSNMHATMIELVSMFESESGINVEIVSGSSGKLSTQIEQGHPIDVFVSADMQYPMHLYRSEYATEKPRIYAYGELAIVAIQGVEASFENMLTSNVHQVAVANPKIAPYGLASLTALRNSGVLDSIESKLVYGQSISHATQFVDAKAAEIGITAKSLVMTNGRDSRNWSPVSDSLYTPLAQGVLLVNQRDLEKPDARRFFDFMTSDQARAILEDHGYSLPTPR